MLGVPDAGCAAAPVMARPLSAAVHVALRASADAPTSARR
jgi:hypothetical protein